MTTSCMSSVLLTSRERTSVSSYYNVSDLTFHIIKCKQACVILIFPLENFFLINNLRIQN